MLSLGRVWEDDFLCLSLPFDQSLCPCFKLGVSMDKLCGVSCNVPTPTEELIKKDRDLQLHPETEDILKVNFASVPGTMLTLMQFVTMDSVCTSMLGLLLAQHRISMVENTVAGANRLLMHDGLMCHGFSVICAVIEGVCLVWLRSPMCTFR